MNDFAAWREKARMLLVAGVAPADAQWDDPLQPSVLQARDPRVVSDSACAFRISTALFDLLETAACHRDPGRFAVMYRLLWRITHGEAHLLDDAADDDVSVVNRLAKAVRLDCHKMTAFVRFREVRQVEADEPRWIAWYEPSHRIVARTAPFFVDRFATMTWTIVTPDGIAHWDRVALTLLPYDPSIPRPAYDAKEALWLTYYESIFNPARLNVRAMQKEMPQKYWANLPEAARIPELVATASQRAGRMVETVSPRSPARVVKSFTSGMEGPGRTDMAPNKADVDRCRRCPLWERATQGVIGKGPPRASLMLVGEQPGDAEDLAGEPFVGPAGKLLRSALERAGVVADAVYITNAVKHFNWEPRGKRRIHKTPSQQAVAACRHWLDEEIRHVRPDVVVALGASALLALTGQKMPIATARARPLQLSEHCRLVATYHPAAILRAPDEGARNALEQALVDDLRRANALSLPRHPGES
ncbi:MAG TPA: UdgX family uracil-DNA binding protein [Casimicrobiaceae bacterium]|nr:UdgX family uracil-DNA binding protein [Casimicrobiaceae bacterium]